MPPAPAKPGLRPYDPDPVTPAGAAPPGSAGAGYGDLVASVAERTLRRAAARPGRPVVALDLAQAPDMDVFLTRFRAAWEARGGRAQWIDTRRTLKPAEAIEREIRPWLTEDPVFGRLCDGDLSLFFDPDRWKALAGAVDAARRGPGREAVFVTGPGALLPPLGDAADVRLYAAVPRETVFAASEEGVGLNIGDDRDRGRWGRAKRSYYVDWPVQNRHRDGVLPSCDLLIDMSDAESPAFVEPARLRDAMARAAERPFRVRPLFMPGVWGGKRLQALVPDLPAEWPNCAWGFELVAPENTVTFDLGAAAVRVPFELFLRFEAARILGPEPHRRFGSYFPIRFDYLDTMRGSNLSCQVHPPDDYIRAHFGEPVAQNEMYYIVETRTGAKVYLGLQESTAREAFLSDVSRAEWDRAPFEIARHVNAWDSRPGDLFLIPAGTVHCSGADNLVLEISATPYLYTFKIYDYLRPDLDGKPRPISFQRAFEVIDFGRKTAWTRENLLVKPRETGSGPGWRRLLLSDSPFFFHAVERIELTGPYRDTTERAGVHILCVVGGAGARIVRESDGAALELSYLETGIVPGACGAYRIEPAGEGAVSIVKSYVRPIQQVATR